MNTKKTLSVVLALQLVGLVGVIVYAFSGSADPFRGAYVWAGINGTIALVVLLARQRIRVHVPVTYLPPPPHPALRFKAEAPSLNGVLWACAGAAVWVPLAEYLFSSGG